MPLAFPKLLPTALGFCPSPAEREPWDCQGKTLGILYWETASPNLRPVPLPVLWNSIWNIRDLLQDEKMRYSSFPFGSVHREIPLSASGLCFTFPILTAPKRLRNCEPASTGHRGRQFKSSITVYMGHLRTERQMLFVFEAALCWNPCPTQERLSRGDAVLWPFRLGFALSPAALQVVVKSLQLCLKPLLPF